MVKFFAKIVNLDISVVSMVPRVVPPVVTALFLVLVLQLVSNAILAFLTQIRDLILVYRARLEHFHFQWVFPRVLIARLENIQVTQEVQHFVWIVVQGRM